MPYILLALGLLIGAYALYRFFIHANTQQIKAMFLSAGIVALAIALFYMALTGKLAAALGLGAAIIPFVIAGLREWGKTKDLPPDDKSEDKSEGKSEGKDDG